jgi:hypothetical protein
MQQARRYNIFHPYVMAFFSRPLYRDVGLNWRGIGGIYLFVLLAICWIPLTILIATVSWALVDGVLPVVLKEMPEISVKNGEISVNRPMPYIISDPKTNQPIVIFDTTDATQSIKDSPAVLLVKKKELIYKKSENEIDSQQIPADVNWVIDQQTVQYYADKAQHWLIWLIYPVLLLCSFIYRFIQALFYAALGSLFFNRRTQLPFQAVMRITMIAITPAIIISTVLGLLTIAFPMEWLAYFVLSMFYLWFGISSCKQVIEVQTPPVVVVPPPQV